MIRKVLLTGLVVFVGVPALWLGVEHWRGRGQLAEAIRRIEARGETLDFQGMLPPGVAASSNGMAALMAATQRAVGRAGLMPPAEVMPPAHTMIGPGTAVPGTRMEWWKGGNGTNNWADLRSVLVRNEEAMDGIHEALAMPWRRPELDLSKGFSRMLIPHLAPMKNAATSLAASALDAARQGDLAGAVEDLKGMRILERDLESEPILISQLVRVAIGAISNSRLWAVLNARDWNESELGELQGALPSEDFTTAMVRSLEGERAGALYEMRHASSQQLAEIWSGDAMDLALGGGPAPLSVPETVDEAVEFAGTFLERLSRGILINVVAPVWRFGWGDQAAAYYLECMEGMLEANRLGIRERSFVPVQQFDLAGRLELPGYGRLRVTFSRTMLPALEKASMKAFRAETERSLHETGIALRRFQLRQGRLPEKLEELVPAFLAAVPTDRMDGKPLRYRREGEKAFTLWSVGEDLKDDGGDATWSEERAKSLNPQWWLARDAVWPQVASAEEIAAWHQGEARKLEKERAAKGGSGGGGARRFEMSAELMKRYGLVPKESAPVESTNSGAISPPPAKP
jgi:hypothetical protein